MKIIKFVLILTLAAGVFGENIYIAQNAAGDDDGSSCTNAHSISWFNTAANWGTDAGDITGGDNVRFCGTISTAAVVQGSGTVGNIIVLKFEDNAKFSTGAWTSDGAIKISNKSYITIDGGTNGTIECTDNGSSENHANTVSAIGVYCYTSSFIIIKNLIIKNIYLRDYKLDSASYIYADGSRGIAITAQSSASYSDISVLNNTISNAKCGILFTIRMGATNILIDNNIIDSCNWGISVATSSANNTADTVTISNNTISNFENWDDTIANHFHHDGILVYSDVATSYIQNLKIFNNSIFGPWGERATAGIYCSSYTFPLIYNNLILSDSINSPSPALIYLRQSEGALSRVINNTLVGQGTGIGLQLQASDGLQSDSVYNNIFSNLTYAVSVANRDNLTLACNNNVSNLCGYSYSVNSSADPRNFSQWQELGFDVDGSIDSLKFNDDYKLTTGSAAISSGKNFYLLFMNDKLGLSRASIGAWDCGAYRYFNRTCNITIRR